MEAFKKYDYVMDHHKYKNNYDYNMTLHILNNAFYMSSGNVLLSENSSLFSPVSVLYYEYYQNEEDTLQILQQHPDVQAIISRRQIPFGKAQQPSLWDYADGINTLQFLSALK